MRPLPLTLDLGPAVIQRMIPHRPPFLLVDRIRGLRLDAEPVLAAEKAIRGDEPVLAGHFPEHPLWPGVYTIEALAQTALLLFRALELGPAQAALLPALADALARDPDAEHPLATALADARGLGVLSAVDVKLLAPVFPPAVLGLEARVLGGWAGGWRVAVRATRARQAVAEGTLGLALRTGE